MQAKDVPDRPVVAFVATHGGIGCNWFETVFEPSGRANQRSVLHAMPDDTPPKVALAKMRALIRRGLVEGCACGCRGDFELTAKGRAWLAERAP